ncbi:conserved Plasmodium protein, unknown function [Plasmodium knowlesi strain H]|uniref:Uncharacterized protein n=3 Tax=Plasmodium knowlesi TaxID=5850 RepID=A0A5K1UTY4_PLAKH|nr:conserved Plasmodium protein, unknown function [Plasmodium knowlesi strain H]OTN67435.1 Uncharacterized protein PKNOH_S06408400 [Plasmodium knowlesi]CAA9987359.1 conserved Plasmodium protein, unknown function [Plasmodium knowlesi strain H]SBO23353.1 conserved Plasmodium protein, unknown function [Plasmodium knowlesi strain H]SBO24505.1 conserved Plasmodium protein, unknown function [Plasmodium knowlesi strain H]VVS76833.1 conserved Plasmodium protein, unknown function [Plasmodium knowlesi s|eukprot:XP_002258362.1 hypothetical protein, conserved in Plasmodium species [Plasmodium knowlesi strain H]
MFKVAPYVPYIYKCSSGRNFFKFYNQIKTKGYSDLLNFAKGLYLFLCRNCHKNDDLFIHFSKQLFRDIHGENFAERNKKDLCLLMLLYMKCRKRSKSFVLGKDIIKHISCAIEDNLDHFDEDDLSTVLTFLNCTANNKLYSSRGIVKNDVSTRITRQIIQRSDNYLHNFRQTKNLCILYSYLCRENISVKLHNNILGRIFSDVDLCGDTDLTNIVFNFYYINSVFFKKFLSKIGEVVGHTQNGSPCTSDIGKLGDNRNETCRSEEVIALTKQWGEELSSQEEHFGDGTFRSDGVARHSNPVYKCDMLGNREGESHFSGEKTTHYVTYGNIFNMYSCSVFLHGYLNHYNNLFLKRSIVKLIDRCNFIDNIWKNCRLMHVFYYTLAYYMNTGVSLEINSDSVKRILRKGYSDEEGSHKVKEVKLYSNIFCEDNIKLLMYVYQGGVRYYGRYFDACRAFLDKYILNLLQEEVSKDESTGKNTTKGTTRVEDEHIYLLLSVLNQMNVQNKATFDLLIRNFKLNGRSYSLKTSLLMLQFCHSHGGHNPYRDIYTHIGRTLDSLISFDNAILPNNFGVLFFPPFLVKEEIHRMYLSVFVRSAKWYLQRKEKAQTYRLTDELLYFALSYNILWRDTNTHGDNFLKYFNLKELKRIYEFIHEFEKITKKNSFKLKKRETKKKKRINRFYFYLEKVHTHSLSNYVEICHQQSRSASLNFLNFFGVFKECSHVYVGYDSKYLSPSVAPQIVMYYRPTM